MNNEQGTWNQKRDSKPFSTYFALTLFFLLLSVLLY